MSVTPQLQELLNQIATLKITQLSIGFKPTQSNVREAFANAQRKYMTDIDYTVFALDDMIYNGKYPVPIRIYYPRLDAAFPIIVYLHGGGHMCGSITQYDGVVRKIAKITDHIVVAIDYRLSPEFAYPTGISDAKAVIKNLFTILDKRKVNYSNKSLCLMGDSAGGAMCASLVMDKDFIKSTNITHQVLLYPALDFTMSSKSFIEYKEGYFLEASKVAWYYEHYLQNNEDRRAISPLFGEFYSGMPKTLVIFADHDPLQDEAKQYYFNMKEVGASAILYKAEKVVHAFFSLEDLCKEECTKAYQQIKIFLLNR